jgi:hypothetical protein
VTLIVALAVLLGASISAVVARRGRGSGALAIAVVIVAVLVYAAGFDAARTAEIIMR